MLGVATEAKKGAGKGVKAFFLACLRIISR